jgi:23S rRNA pseudouridine955/2504/2580 synthase
MFLHALTVELAHPLTGRMLRLEAPLADELQHFLLGLNSN